MENVSFIFNNPPRFLLEYLKLLGCHESQLINSCDRVFQVLPDSEIYFREKDPMWFLCAPQKLLLTTREYLLTTNSSSQNKKIIYVVRKNGYRQPLGLNQIIRDNLSKLGVYFFDPSEVSIQEQIETFSSAILVIGVHGAGLANLMWCQQDTTIIEIFHPHYAPWCYLILAKQLSPNHNYLQVHT